MALYMVVAMSIALLTPIGAGTVDVPRLAPLAALSDVPAGDPPPQLSISDVTIDEDGSSATFTVTRAGKTKKKVKVDVATSDLEATAGADYTATATTIVFPKKPEIVTEEFTVPILDDAIDEDAEGFLVTLSNPVDATIEDDTAIGTIADNDTAGITVDLGDGLFVVEDGAPDSMSIVLTSQPTASVALVITAPSEQLLIEPSRASFDPVDWSTPKVVEVSAVLDGMDEDDPHEVPTSFLVETVDPRYATLLPPSILVSVGDADALLVTIAGPSAGATGMESTFNAVVNAGGSGTITYAWTAFLQGNPVATGNQATFEFTPQVSGAHVVRALVGDEHGQNPAQFAEFTVIADITGSTFAMDIIWLADQGITRGCNPDGTQFCPNRDVSRAQMAAFLVRFLDLTDNGGGNTFIDDDGSIFEDDIAKLAAAGITTGCDPPDNTRFCPDDPVTREQMAAFLVRSLHLTEDGGGNTFTDDDGSPFEGDIAKLAAAGITAGCNPDGTHFCPERHITRGEMAALLHRAAAFVSN